MAADPDAWWLGLPVAGVQVSAPEGGLPEESLDPLLHAEQGELFDANAVRHDLATLYRVGAFRAVEAHAEPWPTTDDRGREVPGVLLTYAVYPAPVVVRVDIEGGDAFRERELLDMIGITPGQGSWFPELDNERLARRLRAALYRKGWINARVAVEAEALSGHEVALVVQIDEGAPNVLEELTFTGDADVVDPSRNHRRLRRLARRAGLVEGRPFAPESVGDARAEIRADLARLRGPYARRGGWINARVSPVVLRTGDGGSRATFHIVAERQLVLLGTGRNRAERRMLAGMPGLFGKRRRVQEALGIDERLRLTRGWLEEAPERLKEALQNEGYLDAQVAVELKERPQRNQLVLRVDIQRGPRHRLPSGMYPSFLGVRFEGNEALSDADLQRVLDQASEDVLRRDYYTESELQKGLDAARTVYAARGYLDASLQLESIERRRWGWWFPSRLVVQPLLDALNRHYEPPVKVIPTVRVEEGPLTTLSRAVVQGAAPDVDLGEVQQALDEMAGEAFSPLRIEELTRRIVEAHRAAGYLEADARVETTAVEPLVREVVVRVQPGVKVRLRSKVTRGLVRTRPAFVRREADLPIGAPVTPLDLQRIRNNLYDLGIFRTVRLDLLGDEAERDLVLDLTERARWGYELGAGLSTDQGVRTFGRLTRRNLWGRAHHVDVIGQVGLVYGSDAVTDWLPDITQPDWRLAVSYTAPRFPLRSQQLVVDAVRARRLERTWRMGRMGTGATLDWSLSPFRADRRDTRIQLGARVETRQLLEVDSGALLPGEPWLEGGLASLPSPWRVQEALTTLLLVDRRDDPVLPRKGVLSSTTAELAPGLPWDRWRRTPQVVTRFLKAETRLSTFVPLGGFVVEVSGSAGHAFSLDQGVIPLEDRFRLGGTGSVRGFQRDVIGPRNRTSRVDIDWPDGIGPVVDYATRNDPERWVPTGGDTRAVGSVELLVPLPAVGLVNWEGYALELFADVGNVWLLTSDTAATTTADPEIAALMPTLRVGTGAGMRVETPVGPLQADIGVNPQAAWARDRAVRNLLVRDFEEPTWRLHLTLGATF